MTTYLLRRILLVFVSQLGWIWVALTLDVTTDAGWSLAAEYVLPFTYLLTFLFALACVLFAFKLFKTPTSIGIAISALAGQFVGLVLLTTDYGLIMRVKLNEAELLAFARSMKSDSKEPELHVGSFDVEYATKAQDEAVLLVTGTRFKDKYGIAYVPEGIRGPSLRSHLFGNWYKFTL